MQRVKRCTVSYHGLEHRLHLELVVHREATEERHLTDSLAEEIGQDLFAQGGRESVEDLVLVHRALARKVKLVCRTYSCDGDQTAWYQLQVRKRRGSACTRTERQGFDARRPTVALDACGELGWKLVPSKVNSHLREL